MIGLLLLLGVVTAVVSGSLMSSTWEKTSESRVLLDKNFKVTNHELTNLEKQKESILSLAKYNNELYIGMMQNYLAKINSDGKITQIPLEDAGKTYKNIILMKEFNGSLYLGNNNELLEMKPNGEVKKIYQTDSEFIFIQFLEVFDNKLYFILSSEEATGSLMKMDSNGKFSKVLDFPFGFFPSQLKAINNKLYYVASDVLNNHGSEIHTIDTNNEDKKIAIMKENELIVHLIEYNNKIYICLDNGSLFTINANGEITEVIKRNLTFGSENLVVFQNELYLGTSSKLEKLTKDNEIETVVEVKESISALATFNDELYIGMFRGYFAKLS